MWTWYSIGVYVVFFLVEEVTPPGVVVGVPEPLVTGVELKTGVVEDKDDVSPPPGVVVTTPELDGELEASDELL